MIKFVLNRGLSRPLFYSRVPAMEHLLFSGYSAEEGFLKKVGDPPKTWDTQKNRINTGFSWCHPSFRCKIYWDYWEFTLL